MTEPTVMIPRINYRHVLQELSVNSRNPCEVIRELISNACDAGATEIRYYPLLPKQLSGFVFFDNGSGMSQTRNSDGVSPYESFFSIGYSTKILGECIGYKCQGAKLAFACRTLTVITRCKEESAWRYKILQNPREELTQSTDITPNMTDHPWTVLSDEVGKQTTPRVKNILQTLNEPFFARDFEHGTMIVVLGFDIGHNFSRYFGTKNDLDEKLGKARKHEASYLWNYIRFFTRHGDVRLLDSVKTGFSKHHENLVQEPVAIKEPPAKLFVWVDEGLEPDHDRFWQQLKEIPAGYPYLEIPQQVPLGPKEISQLKSGRFYSRHAGTFEFEDETYTWILAVDGSRRALDEYDTLGRQKSSRSGIPLSTQRGPHLCAEGIKICQYNRLFLDLSDYDILADPRSFPYYTFFLDGPFHLVTDRNAVTAVDEKTLNEPDFRVHLKRALDSILHTGEDRRNGVDHTAVFASLLERLKNDMQYQALEKELKKINVLKSGLPRRCQFLIKTGLLGGRAFVYPGPGEENWVGALYTLLAQFAKDEPRYAQLLCEDLWVRPVNMAGISIDAMAVPLEAEGLAVEQMKGLEYKLAFTHDDIFNHPLLSVEYIVCWEFSQTPANGVWINDEYDYMGCVNIPNGHDGHLFYEITKLQKQDGSNPKKGATIKVVCLKELIKETFDCEMDQ